MRGMIEINRNGEDMEMEANREKIERMKELSAVLREAGKAYYQEDREIMSNTGRS